MRDLYAQYVQRGDKRFKYNLETVKDRLETSWADEEFIDEEQRKDNINRKRLSLEAGQAKEDALAKRLAGEDRKQLK